jgi:enediyne biosynthesis protein E3
MWLNRALFSISLSEASFARRKFQDTTPAKRAHLEHIGRTFIAGYLAALEAGEVEALAERLNGVDAEFRGFAFEGAAMGLAVTDHVWRRRSAKFERFLRGPAAMHRYMLHVGYGWAVARLPWLRRDPERVRRRHGEYLGWLIADGYGFHEGYFHWRSAVIDMKRPRGVRGYATRAFDQGLGRALWFFNGADVERAAACIGRFASERQPDLWSGIGLAATYAGGAGKEELKALLRGGEEYRSHLAQGAAFAAKARHFAGIGTPHTETACRVFCGMPAFEAAAVTDGALQAVQRGGREGGEPYEAWRAEIRAQFENHHKICAIVGK